jgi:Tfp pilus assembly protein PilX
MVVATVILAIGGVAAMMAIGSCTRAMGNSESYSRAAMLAEVRLAEIESDTSTLTSGEQQGDFGSDYPGYSWVQNVETTDLTDVVRVTITVNWSMGARPGRATFITLLRTTSST